MRFFDIGARRFSANRPLVIAEIGTGHGGDIVKARELVDAAAASGADCAKFQHVYADEIIHPKTGLVPLPGGAIPLYERFRSLELPVDFLTSVKEHAERRGMIFLCTPFGLRSARELRSIGVEGFKVASPELNFTRLLDELAKYGLPVVLSSGVSRLADIEAALDRLRATGADMAGVALLHCVTAYPAPETDYNLRLVTNLSGIFGIPCGVSDHSMDPVLVPLLSLACGGCIVEKHICLSRDDPGLDDPIALPPEGFSRMVRELRFAADKDAGSILRECSERFGSDKVEAVLGDGIKRLAPSECANYGRTNRSLHAKRPIAAGELFDLSNVAELRTEKILRPGLPPSALTLVLGRHASRRIEDGEGIGWEDVGG
ncbi:MAG: N-acetylneuraminate synthase family protein [Spirochaetes bacterium]|nr:N-acetylneuraminate synthase family protein [Spirochaetota bacterium]